MIGIGINEPCPFCKGKDKFISKAENSFVDHIMKEHPEDMATYVFGMQDKGM